MLLSGYLLSVFFFFFLMFNLSSFDIVKQVEELAGLKIYGRTTNSLRCANDLLLLVESELGLQDQVDQVNRSSTEY